MGQMGNREGKQRRERIDRLFKSRVVRFLECLVEIIGRWVDFNRHNLGDAATLDNDDERANAPAIPAPFLRPLDVSYDERVMNIGPRYNVGRDYRKSTRARVSFDGVCRRKGTSDLRTI